MKSIIATLILAAAVGQAQAEGFYQAVVGRTNAVVDEQGASHTKFDYSPLYLQVVGNGERLGIDADQHIATSGFSYTPLYLTVIGQHS